MVAPTPQTRAVVEKAETPIDQTVPGKYGTAFTQAGGKLCREIGDGYFATQYQPEKWNTLAEVYAKIERLQGRKAVA